MNSSRRPRLNDKGNADSLARAYGRAKIDVGIFTPLTVAIVAASLFLVDQKMTYIGVGDYKLFSFTTVFVDTMVDGQGNLKALPLFWQIERESRFLSVVEVWTARNDGSHGHYIWISYWPLAIILSISSVYALIRKLKRFLSVQRKMSRASQLLCIECGYDLRGSTERCPECGRSFEHAIEQQVEPSGVK